MKTYITEIVKRTEKEYGFFVGPRISASSWTEATSLAQEQGAILVGELAN